jgi:DNA replication ATP-dependent helicase Dna2
MLHEVIQKCLLEERWDQPFIHRCVDEAVLAGLGNLVKVGLNEDVAQREVQDRATGLKVFQEKYLHNVPKVLNLSYSAIPSNLTCYIG